MNPAIVIPTYQAAPLRKRKPGPHPVFDHATSVNVPGELPRCLASLEKVEGLGQVILLVAADEEVAPEAARKVQAIADDFPDMHTLVVGDVECSLIQQRLAQRGFDLAADAIGFGSYGAVRNLGLVVANILGFDAVIFVDDDEVVEDATFMQKAVYGLGKLTKKGIPILAKSGFYYNDKGNYHSKSQNRWYNHWWEQGRAFNRWIDHAMQGPRLSRSNHVCGGCLAVHREAFRRTAFDPWIHRGEDLDYLLNLRMYGSDVWFDNQWSLTHLPPRERHEGERFRRDIYRWLYEYSKVEFSRSQIDLLQIKPSSLEPYPGPFLEPGILKRVSRTARLRSLARPDKAAYRQAATEATGLAVRYAERNCGNYFELQRVWSELMLAVEEDDFLLHALVQIAYARQAGEEVIVVPAQQPEEPVAAPAPATTVPEVPAPIQEERPRHHVPDAATLNLPNINVDPGLTTEIHLNLREE